MSEETDLKTSIRKAIHFLESKGNQVGAEAVWDLWDAYQRALIVEKPRPIVMRQDGPQIPRDILRATYGGYTSARHEDDELHAENIAQNQRDAAIRGLKGVTQQNNEYAESVARERFERTDGS